MTYSQPLLEMGVVFCLPNSQDVQYRMALDHLNTIVTRPLICLQSKSLGLPTPLVLTQYHDVLLLMPIEQHQDQQPALQRREPQHELRPKHRPSPPPDVPRGRKRPARRSPGGVRPARALRRPLGVGAPGPQRRRAMPPRDAPQPPRTRRPPEDQADPRRPRPAPLRARPGRHGRSGRPHRRRVI